MADCRTVTEAARAPLWQGSRAHRQQPQPDRPPVARNGEAIEVNARLVGIERALDALAPVEPRRPPSQQLPDQPSRGKGNDSGRSPRSEGGPSVAAVPPPPSRGFEQLAASGINYLSRQTNDVVAKKQSVQDPQSR